MAKSELRVIDVHAHILPGIDDGSRTMEESIRLLEMAVSQGISAVIATPHYSRHGKNADLDRLTEELRTAVHDRLPELLLYTGQETYYHESLPERLKEKQAWTLSGSPYVLVEFSPGDSYQQLYRGIRKLVSFGYIPVLAHVERYACLRQGRNLEELMGCGCRLQMNYDSLKGSFLSSETRWCRKQVLEGRIFLLGTDMHRLDFRPPDIREPLSWLEGHVEPELLRKMVHDNALRIIQAE